MDDFDQYDDYEGGDYGEIINDSYPLGYSPMKWETDSFHESGTPGGSRPYFQQRQYEIALLIELVSLSQFLTQNQQLAFRSMLTRMAMGQLVLTQKQLDWAQNIAKEIAVDFDNLPRTPDMLKASGLAKLTFQEARALGLLKDGKR